MTRLSVAGITAAVFAVTSAVLFGIAIGFDPTAGAELVERIPTASSDEAGFIKWGALTDLLGYYLLPAALVVATRERVPWTSPVARDLAVTSFVMYATIGSIGCAALAGAAAPLVETGTDAAFLATVVRVVEGLWQWVEPVPFTMWATAMALTLRARGSQWVWAFGVLALGGVLVWFGRILGVDGLLIPGLVLWLAPFPVIFAAVGAWTKATSRNDFGTVGG